MMRGLNVLVVVMGIAIVVAATVLATMLVQRAGQVTGGSGAPVVEQDAGAALTDGAAAYATLSLPVGAQLVDSRLDGNRLLLRLALADGAARVLVFDVGDGRLLGRFDLVPGASSPTADNAVPSRAGRSSAPAPTGAAQ